MNDELASHVALIACILAQNEILRRSALPIPLKSVDAKTYFPEAMKLIQDAEAFLEKVQS